MSYLATNETPGPWHFEVRDGRAFISGNRSASNHWMDFAEVIHTMEDETKPSTEALANIHLIVQAPMMRDEILELKRQVTALEGCLDDVNKEVRTLERFIMNRITEGVIE
jgi:hypothetical protein